MAAAADRASQPWHDCCGGEAAAGGPVQEVQVASDLGAEGTGTSRPARHPRPGGVPACQAWPAWPGCDTGGSSAGERRKR